jgi:hypothetical protein
MSMNGRDVSPLTRWLRGLFSRRILIRILLFIPAFFPRSGYGAQISQLSCGVAGDVCTLLHGCCDGLTCATSRINTAYGICVTGSGGTMAVTDSVIAPAASGTAERIAELAADADSTDEDTGATDATVERSARRQEKKTRLAERKDRKHDALVQRRDREDQQRDRRRENRRRESPSSDPEPNDPTNQSPELEFEVLNAGSVGGIETLVVANRALYSAVFVGISSMSEYQNGDMVMFPEGSVAALAPGDSFQFISQSDLRRANLVGWRSSPVCSADATDDGFVLRAAFTLNSINTDYYVLCDRPNASKTLAAIASGHRD